MPNFIPIRSETIWNDGALNLFEKVTPTSTEQEQQEQQQDE